MVVVLLVVVVVVLLVAVVVVLLVVVVVVLLLVVVVCDGCGPRLRVQWTIDRSNSDRKSSVQVSMTYHWDNRHKPCGFSPPSRSRRIRGPARRSSPPRTIRDF